MMSELPPTQINTPSSQIEPVVPPGAESFHPPSSANPLMSQNSPTLTSSAFDLPSDHSSTTESDKEMNWIDYLIDSLKTSRVGFYAATPNLASFAEFFPGGGSGDVAIVKKDQLALVPAFGRQRRAMLILVCQAMLILFLPGIIRIKPQYLSDIFNFNHKKKSIKLLSTSVNTTFLVLVIFCPCWSHSAWWPALCAC